MAEKAESEFRPPQPAKKAPAELPEMEGAPLPPTPPLQLPSDPAEAERVLAQYWQEMAAWKQREDAWRLQYWQRYDKVRAERQAKDQEAARALTERLAKNREAAKNLPAEFLASLPLPPRWLAATRAERERDQREYEHKLTVWEQQCQILLRQRELERRLEERKTAPTEQPGPQVLQALQLLRGWWPDGTIPSDMTDLKLHRKAKKQGGVAPSRQSFMRARPLLKSSG